MGLSALSPVRLIRHDALLLSNLARAAFATWRDRLTLVIAAPLLLAIGYDRLLSLPPGTARYLCAFAAFALAFVAAKAIAHRLEFFRTESVLAMDGLSPAPARRYALAGICAATLPISLLIALLDPSALPISLAALLAGCTLAGLSNVGGLLALVPRRKAGFHAVQTWLARPIAGVALALLFIVVVAIVMAVSLSTSSDRAAIIGIAALILALPLAGVNDTIVRFMALSGFSAWRTIWHPMRGLLIFAVIAAPVAGLAAGPMATAVIAAAAFALLLMVAMRVLAYRIYGRRFADLVVSILFGMLLVAAFAAPLVLPLLVPAMLWWLVRRARRSTWLLA